MRSRAEAGNVARNDARVFLDPDLQRAFDRDGFAVTRLLSADEAAETLERVMALRDRSEFASNTPGPAPTYHVSLLDPDLDYRRAARSVAKSGAGGTVRTDT